MINGESRKQISVSRVLCNHHERNKIASKVCVLQHGVSGFGCGQFRYHTFSNTTWSRSWSTILWKGLLWKFDFGFSLAFTHACHFGGRSKRRALYLTCLRVNLARCATYWALRFALFSWMTRASFWLRVPWPLLPCRRSLSPASCFCCYESLPNLSIGFAAGTCAFLVGCLSGFKIFASTDW